MRASRTIYHPNGNADTFKTVEETLDALQFGDDAKIGGSTGDTDNILVRSDGTEGKTIQSTGIAVDDSDNVSGINDLAIDGNMTAGGTAVPVVGTTANFRGNTSGNLALTPSNTWGGAAFVALTDGASIAVDMSTGWNFSVSIAGNRTLANPTNTKVGQSGCFKVTASSADRTIDVGTNYKKTTDITFPVTIASGTTAYIFYFVASSTVILVTAVLNGPA